MEQQPPILNEYVAEGCEKFTHSDRLYSKEQIEEWASKRADDAGRLSRQLLDTLRDNERLRDALLYARNLLRETYECDYAIIEEALSNKDSEK